MGCPRIDQESGTWKRPTAGAGAGLQKYKTSMRWQESHEVVRQAGDAKRRVRQQHRQRHECYFVFKAGRRPASKIQDKHEMTSEPWCGKTSRRYQEEGQTTTQTETRVLLKKKAGRRPASEIQDKHEMTSEPDVVRQAGDAKRRVRQQHRQRHAWY